LTFCFDRQIGIELSKASVRNRISFMNFKKINEEEAKEAEELRKLGLGEFSYTWEGYRSIGIPAGLKTYVLGE
jgi:hypothetical protein